MPALSKIYLLWHISISGRNIKCKSVNRPFTGGAPPPVHPPARAGASRASMNGFPLYVLDMYRTVYCT